jgi:KaiC/GvpD/RAD55 family RecA-like ATPase
MAKIEKLKSRLTKINDVTYAPGLFEAHKTGTPLDGLFSIDGGVPKATNWMIAGDPGCGKCVHPKTLVTIKIDSTGEIITIPIEEVHNRLFKPQFI